MKPNKSKIQQLRFVSMNLFKIIALLVSISVHYCECCFRSCKENHKLKSYSNQYNQHERECLDLYQIIDKIKAISEIDSKKDAIEEI